MPTQPAGDGVRVATVWAGLPALDRVVLLEGRFSAEQVLRLAFLRTRVSRAALRGLYRRGLVSEVRR